MASRCPFGFSHKTTTKRGSLKRLTHTHTHTHTVEPLSSNQIDRVEWLNTSGRPDGPPVCQWTAQMFFFLFFAFPLPPNKGYKLKKGTQTSCLEWSPTSFNFRLGSFERYVKPSVRLETTRRLPFGRSNGLRRTDVGAHSRDGSGEMERCIKVRWNPKMLLLHFKISLPMRLIPSWQACTDDSLGVCSRLPQNAAPEAQPK